MPEIQPSDERDSTARDMAARAAWLSFVGGLTQDQIAQEMGISRQRAQRLVAKATSEGLIRVRIEHPIAECLELERALKDRFGLAAAWVAPSAGTSDPVPGLARYAAPVLERMFCTQPGRTIALGTGRTLRMVVDQMSALEGAHNRLVSLIGNVAPDGSASFFEVIMRFAEITGARHYPMSIPVAARNAEELELFRALPHVRAARSLAQSADLAIVGIGQMADDAPLFVDGFLKAEELADLQAAGAIGEICGHVYDSDGKYLDHPINHRVTGVRVPVNEMPVFAIAGGPVKLPGLRAALRGKLLHGLVVDETSARALLDS